MIQNMLIYHHETAGSLQDNSNSNWVDKSKSSFLAEEDSSLAGKVYKTYTHKSRDESTAAPGQSVFGTKDGEKEATKYIQMAIDEECFRDEPSAKRSAREGESTTSGDGGDYKGQPSSILNDFVSPASAQQQNRLLDLNKVKQVNMKILSDEKSLLESIKVGKQVLQDQERLEKEKILKSQHKYETEHIFA
jgi:hypothetical protein